LINSHIGLSYQNAKFVSDHKDPIKRAKWLNETWPAIVAMDIEKRSQILFGDGCFYNKAIDVKFNSQSYTEFLLEILEKSKGHLILIQKGARHHTSK
jgi:hypothetical protein